MMRLIHLSDPHFGAADADIARAFIRSARELEPDLTILSGDLSMTARRRELNAAAAFIRELPKPFMVIPGNHDIPYFNHPYDRFFRPFRRYQQRIHPEIEPVYQNDFFDVMSLNSPRPFGFHADWSDGRLSRAQIGRIQEHFAATPEHVFKVLVIHHPVLELKVAGRAVVKPLTELMAALESARVDLLLCGHFHRSQIAPVSLEGNWKTIISQAPTVCSTRLQGEPQGFHEILISAEKSEVVHHVFREGNFEVKAIFPFQKTAAGWEHTTPV